MFNRIIGSAADDSRRFGLKSSEEHVNPHIHELRAEKPVDVKKLSEAVCNPSYGDLFQPRSQAGDDVER